MSVLTRKAWTAWATQLQSPFPAIPPSPKRAINKTETRYIQDWLAPMRAAGAIAQYDFEAIRLRLAPRTTYTPDFAVWLPDGRLELHEIKGGFAREDAMVKLKVAARLYPAVRFVLARWRRGEWLIREVSPA